MPEDLNWFQWATAVLVVSLAMLVSFYLLRRFRDANKLWTALRVTARVRLNRHAELLLVEIDEQRFLIAATSENVTKIATLDNVSAIELEAE